MALSQYRFSGYALGFHFAYDKALENSPNPETRLSLGVAFATLTIARHDDDMIAVVAELDHLLLGTKDDPRRLATCVYTSVVLIVA